MIRGRSPNYFLTWLALMILLALTFGSSYIPMGPWNTVANTGISCVKALLIAIFFMHLRNAGALLRIAAFTGLVFLALLFGLSSADYVTRSVSPAPWSAPR
jgi:cytochrome c oxidase subunit 4